MTPKQRSYYWSLWSQVRDQWPDADRHELHVQALGKDVSSSLLTNAQFDQVIAEFKAIIDPSNLNAQIRQLRMIRKRLIWKITIEQTSLLAVLLGKPADPDRHAAETYILSVCRDKFGTDDFAGLNVDQRIRGAAGTEKSDLETLRDTLDARINVLRGERGLTIHQLRTLAGVKCTCSKCARPGHGHDALDHAA